MTELTQAYLRRALTYYPMTGEFIWNERDDQPAFWNPKFAGKPCGFIHHTGYRYIRVNWKKYGAHRLAFLYMEGRWPIGEIDHIDGDRADNCWLNLREATRAQNRFNTTALRQNTSGFKGAFWIKKNKRWKAQIMAAGKMHYLGCFSTAEEAARAYDFAARQYHGEFARLNFP